MGFVSFPYLIRMHDCTHCLTVEKVWEVVVFPKSRTWALINPNNFQVKEKLTQGGSGLGKYKLELSINVSSESCGFHICCMLSS